MEASQSDRKTGFICAISAHLCWGFMPLLFHSMKQIDAVDIVAVRTILSFLGLIGLVLVATKIAHPALPRPKELRKGIRMPILMKACAVAAILLATNWIAFVWAVTHEHAIDASLGYYICPQVFVLLGVFILKEKLSIAKWIAVALSAAGVAYMARDASGIPWISFIIAFSWGFYAFTKKKTILSPMTGLTFETGILFLPAVVFLAWKVLSGSNLFADNWLENGLLACTGIATILPLALYAKALKHIPLTTMGILQFIGPTMQFLVGYFILKEDVTPEKFVGFGIVWAGVILFLSAPKVKT
jgi:chloramphenicol-sensitive protein RarD